MKTAGHSDYEGLVKIYCTHNIYALFFDSEVHFSEMPYNQHTE
ncbi:MAG: hypothetical protein ACLPX5_10665 [Dissulfurispiraceae bacterium]